MGTTNRVYIYGASGHGKVVADIAERCGYEIAGFIDDDPSKDAITFEQFLKNGIGSHIALGIGSNRARAAVYEKLLEHGLGALTLVHPDSVIAHSVKLGEGTVVMAGVVINPDALVAKGAIINTGAIIEHDNKIGAFVHISPKAALAGDVTVGEFGHVGIGASVIQGITIGEYATVGAGSTVIRDVDANSTVVGTPAKEIVNG